MENVIITLIIISGVYLFFDRLFKYLCYCKKIEVEVEAILSATNKLIEREGTGPAASATCTEPRGEARGTVAPEAEAE